jgi:hypothetical protein
MISLCALVRGGVVIGLYAPSDDNDYTLMAKQFDFAIDVSGMVPQPQIGWIFDGQQLLQTNGSLPVDWRITKLAFRLRFTTNELVGIIQASATNFVIQMLLSNQSVANYIDLSLSTTLASVEVLVAYGLLTSQRMTQIMTTIPAFAEMAYPPEEP